MLMLIVVFILSVIALGMILRFLRFCFIVLPITKSGRSFSEWWSDGYVVKSLLGDGRSNKCFFPKFYFDRFLNFLTGKPKPDEMDYFTMKTRYYNQGLFWYIEDKR